jgi:integrase
VTTHSFRKTVATALDRADLSARDIADYLGHENPSITQDVYMAKNTGGDRAALALEQVLSGARA